MNLLWFTLLCVKRWHIYIFHIAFLFEIKFLSYGFCKGQSSSTTSFADVSHEKKEEKAPKNLGSSDKSSKTFAWRICSTFPAIAWSPNKICGLFPHENWSILLFTRTYSRKVIKLNLQILKMSGTGLKNAPGGQFHQLNVLGYAWIFWHLVHHFADFLFHTVLVLALYGPL